MKDSELRITQFNFFCVLIDELMKSLVAREGKLTIEDTAYIWNQAKKELDNVNKQE